MAITNRKVSAVIPCLNEEETIGICIAKVIKAFKKLGVDGEVIVGDNGSTDNSAKIARDLGAIVVNQPVRGYGAALQAAIEAAKGDYIIMGDADDSYDWGNIAPFLIKLEEGNELVMGNRFKGGIMPGAMPVSHRYFGNPLFSLMARTISSAPVGDFYCGMRAFTKKRYEKLRLTSLGMEFAIEMVVNAARTDTKIAEAPIILYPDKRSKAPHLRTFIDGWRTLRFILTYAPNYLHLVPGALLFLIGAALQILLVKGPVIINGFYIGIHFLALGCLLTLVGFNIINIGALVKVLLVTKTPLVKDNMVIWLKNNFSLELGLIVGGLLLAGGLAIDGALLWKWLFFSQPMEDSIHVAFIATNVIAISVNIIFSSFLIGLFLEEAKRDSNPGGMADV
ncbi:dolichol-p-glucose synthetase, (glycosyltransferase) [hydrothermal vent metagenome]|uniref:Dolichol-p-glucose synthetase, (Glycosyltransferase) n=1 Tax=hydrothermal vent metagenome TaxID=652676 RepID=A0A3B1CTD6_9ZZZZ